MGKAFQAFNHGTGKIDLGKHKNIAVFRPIEIHLKEAITIFKKPWKVFTHD